jgi:phosphatidylinositol alpha-1,6-mannosyltransferase
MKKSLLITLDFPPRRGGVAGYYANLCKNFPADKIVVLAPTGPDTEYFDGRQRFPVIRNAKLAELIADKPGLFNISGKLKLLSLIKEIDALVKNHQIRMIQIGQILPLGTLALIIKKRKKIPFIFYAHGMDITVPQKISRKNILLKKIIKNAQAIVANSYFTANELVKLGAANDQVTVAYPCPNIAAEHLNENFIENYLLQQELVNKKIILSFGRLVERKGHDQVIKALPLILKKIPKAVYLIAGDGPNRSKLEKLVSQMKLGQNVKFISQVNDELLPVLYHICDVMAMPSRMLVNGDVEGFGIVYLEANLFGKPVIGGKSGGVPEAVANGKTGLLVDPNNTEEIALALIAILSDEAYAHRLGIQGMERAHRDFSWFDQASKIIKIL